MTQNSNSNSHGDILVRRGYIILLLSIIIVLFGVYSLLLAPILSYFRLPPVCSHNKSDFLVLKIKQKTEINRLVADDARYKYFPFLVVPAGLLFVIANWVGWQYYQNS